MTGLTIFALFGDDFRIAFGHPDEDWIFFGVSTVALFLFAFELLISSIGKRDYFLGFYFFLDFISTVSLVPDTGLIDFTEENYSNNNASDNEALKAGRASKASKATRVIRLVRLVRMVRIVKLWKMHGGNEDENEQFEAEQKAKDNDIEPTKVGKRLNEMTTRKLIIMILSTVMLLPYLDVSGWQTEVDDYYVHSELSNLWNIASGTYSMPKETQMVDQFVESVGSPLLYVKMCKIGVSNSNTQCLERFPNEDYPSIASITDKLRGPLNEDQLDSNVVQYQQVTAAASYDETTDSFGTMALIYVDYSEKAVLNIIKTIIVMLIIVYGTLNFQRDAQSLVLTPINRMVTVVHTLSENPLANTSALQSLTHQDSENNKETENYETILLEKTILKIGGLLQIGFGAAGASIIGKNMKAGALNPMVPGKMITSIYGFCDIRNFTDTTECLQEEVMVYVNKLGFIVHGATNDYYGMANKNVGDAFLLSWKICDDLLPGFNAFEEEPNDEIRIRACETVRCAVKGAGTVERKITPTEMADSALAAFLKCLVDLDNANTKGSLTEYLSNDRVVKRFGPDFRIKMGFGMHVGWAIEGAIGSHYKIDATYMSPHVEMSDRLEAGSKIFGVPINISHWLVALFSPAARKFLRPIDRILVEGCPTPMTVYTYDVTNFPKKFMTAKVGSDNVQKAVDFANDKQFKDLQADLHPAFLENARSGVEKYLAGDWPEAKRILEMCLMQKAKDGPSLRLLGIMSESDFVAPKDWPGYYTMLEGY
ncbi:hypothetical protein TrVE_jg6898 [Triparma verrucosa]|jgi:class 3 adenylate cyclase|uniref:Guanylate cyclase domain-containing protein n=1 Tax=Triparma verrucosa TaxID=1606542 RepID=A0A9W7BIA6_9STRA|nr:hypothetical protein TrVE_jg6898 [Triparma verrucosa]|eukprot:CAMPEP_0182505110 /NCGR_PEP_ID=MMETSP1321-20130603/18489_1 /TAXON_ID=91990 /ORGANISM="Bolidomonas sp., Strain RCC1657" /LENGTH=766 /DNA_ID=CAMNT_0024710585 /DNA_START=83 /DNA_END=2383 /DNA_ORIENTATION=-